VKRRSRTGSAKPRRRKSAGAKSPSRVEATCRGATPSAPEEESEIALLRRQLSEARQALAESEYKLGQIVQAVPSMVWVTGPRGEVTTVNQRARDYIGTLLEDFLHLGWNKLVHPDDLSETINAFTHAIQSGASYDAVHRLRRADGEYLWHHSLGEPLRDRQGRIIQWYGLSIDIDESKKAEDRLRRSEAWLSQAQRLSHTGNWVYNPTTMLYVYWSDESYRIWGFDVLQGLPSRDAMWQRIHPDDRDRVWAAVREAVRHERDFTAEFRILLPDGTVKYLEGTSHHVLSPLGALVEVFTTTVDVTQRRRAQDEHEKLRRLESDFAHINRVSTMGELAASLSHEIKQPVAAARLCADTATRSLDKSPPDLVAAKKALAGIMDSADRADDIINRIRDQIKKVPPQKKDFDLNEAIDEVIGLARSAIIENRISVQTRLAERSAIHGDRVQIQQVLLNLILNAVEAMGSVETGPRELLISTEQDNTGVLVAVCDSGPGIDGTQLERVFDTFYTTKSNGTGMGLSICRHIIDAHEGRLWADANKPRGTVFQFTLPNASAL
jgi:PAS domain S-box-containing protein